MLPSVGLFLQLFVSHLVRMVSVTDLATVPVILGGLVADAEQVNIDYYFNMLFPACLASFLFPSLVTRKNLQVLQSSMKDC